MTQQSVYNLLKRKKKWLSAKQIAKHLKIRPGSATANLKKLFNQGIIQRKNLKPRESLFEGFGYQPYLWRIK